jgi:hypothetical protein
LLIDGGDGFHDKVKGCLLVDKHCLLVFQEVINGFFCFFQEFLFYEPSNATGFVKCHIMKEFYFVEGGLGGFYLKKELLHGLLDVAFVILIRVLYRQRTEKLLFSDMLFAEIVSNNLVEGEIFNYSSWCLSTPIPTFFTNTCSPVLEGTTKTAQFDS